METRSLKELLEIILDNQKYFSTGLCVWISDLTFNNIINKKEKTLILTYLRPYLPKYKYPFTYKNYLSNDLVFSWKPGNIKPRINFINKHIKLNTTSNEGN